MTPEQREELKQAAQAIIDVDASNDAISAKAYLAVSEAFSYRATPSAILSLIAQVEALTVPQGYKLVPVEPTPEMYDAAGASLYGYSRANAIEWEKEDKFESQADAGCDAYRDMLDAAPTIPAIPGTKEGA